MTTSLIVYPSYFDDHSILDSLEEARENRLLIHYASVLLEQGLPDEGELEEALYKAIRAALAARLPARRHFRKVFVSYGQNLKTDWLVSDLGLRLIMMNADASNPIVARLQVEILSGAAMK